MDVVLLWLTTFGFTYMVRYIDHPVWRYVRSLMGFIYVPVAGKDGEICDYLESIPNKGFAKFYSCWWCACMLTSIIINTVYALMFRVSVLYWFMLVISSVAVSWIILSKLED